MTIRPLATRALPLALVCAVQLGAQPSPIRIQDEPTCPKCTITLRVLSTLDPPPDAAVDRPWNVTADKSGRFWMLLEQELPAVYAPSGKFLQSVGRKGAGPGEYQFPQSAVAAGDSIVIFDQGRATVVDPSLKATRHIVVPYQMMSPRVVSWPDAVIVNARGGGRPETGARYRRVSFKSSDASATEFGVPWVFDPPLRAYGEGHLFAPAENGGIWTVRAGAYQFSEWSEDGKLLEAFDRTSSWFPTEPEFRMASPTRQPYATVAGFDRDASGLLWVFINMPAATWKEAYPPGRSPEVMVRKIRMEKMYTTRVEIIDPKAGRVVARQDFPRYMLNSLGNGRVAFFHRDQDDLAKTTIAQLTLTGR